MTTGRFQGRGMLLDGALYLTRSADRELVDALSEGRHCHVLAPRQVGKSNLRVRATAALRKAGIRCASVDLTGIGSDVDEGEWYFGLARFVARRFGLSTDVDAFWSKHERMSLPQRWIDLVRTELLQPSSDPVVLFFDEIDVTLGLHFSRDDFFRSIVFMQNARGDDPAWERLTFCLMGVAAPMDLVENLRLTPFNKSTPIQLDDFTREELEPGRALLDSAGDGGALLDSVFEWTHGHPALTQQLCESLVLEGPDPARSPAERVGALVEETYLRRGRTDDPILADVNNRFTGTDSTTLGTAKMLAPYKQVLTGEPTPAEGGSRVQIGLRIAGLLAERRDATGSWIKPRNKIFATIFDVDWVDEQLKARAYADPLTRWLQGGKKDDDVLVGGRLEEALAWTKGRTDVTADELEFLLAGKTVERRKREEQEKHRDEQVARERAEHDARQARRLAQTFAVMLVGAVTSAMLVLWMYRTSEQARQAAVLQTQQYEQKAQRDKDDAAKKSKAAEDASLVLEQKAHDVQEKADDLAKKAQDASDLAAKARADADDAAAKVILGSCLPQKAKSLNDDAVRLKEAADAAQKTADDARAEAEKARSEANLAKSRAVAAAADADTRATYAQQAADRAREEQSSEHEKLVAALKSVDSCNDDLVKARSESATYRSENDDFAKQLKKAKSTLDARSAELKTCTEDKLRLTPRPPPGVANHSIR